jgi:thiol-disulfide isomerase/thioredoxin
MEGFDMLLAVQFLGSVFAQAMTYEKYLSTGDEDQQQKWRNVYEAVSLGSDQEELLKSFIREMNILVLSGIWCGDCVEQCPLIAHIARATPMINLRFIDRDSIPELRDNLIINNGNRVPVVLFLAEDFSLCGWYGDRSLTRYRAIARKQLGSACSTGLFVPEADELKQTLQDWLDEFERIQIMLRLSTRLREKHND